jgi:HPt (histidine-containing phosphotransfer) domain-containing protein
MDLFLRLLQNNRRSQMEKEKLYDMTFLNNISGGDEGFIREMVKTFKEVAPEYLGKSKILLGNNDIDALSKETHKLIPGVTFLGAKHLESNLMLIEEFTKKKINLEEVPELLDNCERMIIQLIEVFDLDFS